MTNKELYRVTTISELHYLRGLPPPEYPLISVINLETIKTLQFTEAKNLTFDFYSICIKRCLNGKFRYGQHEYNFSQGLMSFMAPGQVFGMDAKSHTESMPSGWVLLFHPDFLWNTPLAKTINKYEYFGYAVNEALFLSEKEEGIIKDILRNIEHEYHSNIDNFSQDIIIAQLDLLLSYSERFYHRQFITRKIDNHKILERLEEILTEYFNRGDLLKNGLPTVEDVAGQLNLSPNYLSGLLKVLTGQSTQQHIHNKLIEKAKEKLSITDLSVKEIAAVLGFEHSQSFNRLFKQKTNLSPLEFRQSFHGYRAK